MRITVPQVPGAEQTPLVRRLLELIAFLIELVQQLKDEIARLNRNFHPHDPDDHHHRPYLGIDLEYTTQCYLGMEEHGFEVVNVYPNSPAARAGLVARTESTPAGDLKALGSILLLPIAPITFPLLRKSGALGTGGDLIIAVDDVRVRTPEEIRYALGHLKPGDTAYITVIRPLVGGYHRTMRIALHIDHETDAAGNVLSLPATSPGAAPSVAIRGARRYLSARPVFRQVRVAPPHCQR